MLSKYSGFTYGLAEGLSPCWSCSTASLSKPKPLDGGILPLLGDRPSQPSEAALFLLYGEGMLVTPSPLSSGREALISPDSVSNLPSEQRPPLAFPLSTSPSTTGTWYSAGASILVSTGSAES